LSPGQIFNIFRCRMQEKRDVLSLPFLIVFSSVISFVRLGDTVSFSQADEAVYMRIAYEMLQRHDFWAPTWFGDYAFYKPPLAYWLMMCSYSLCGVTEMAARIPSALSAVFTSVFTFLIGRRLFDERAGLLSGLIVATAYGSVVYGHSAMMDIPLVCLMTGALLCFLFAADGRPAYLMMFFVLTGASCLVKGPVSAVILAIAVLSWCALFRDFRAFRTPLTIAGVSIVIAFNALWPAMLSQRGLFDNWLLFFIFRENAGKFYDTAQYSPFIIPGYLLLYMLPWTGLYIASLAETIKTKGYRDRGIALLLLYTAAVIAVYLIPHVRHQYYVLPVIPAASLLVAGTFHRSRLTSFPLYGIVLTCIPIIGSMALLPFVARLFGHGAISLPVVLIELLLAAACAGLFADFHKAGRLMSESGVSTAICAGLAFTVFSIAVPSYSFDIFPPSAQKALTGQELAIAGYEPHIFAQRSGKRAIRIHESYRANDFLRKGSRVVLPGSLMASFRQAGEDSLIPVRILASWRYWKGSISAADLLSALGSGDIGSLTEEHFVIEKKQRIPMAADSPETAL